jgi:hypothetical protein
VVFHLAEVLAAEELLEADDLGAARGGLSDTRDRLPHVLRGLHGAAVLHQAQGDGRSRRLTHELQDNS